MSFGRLEARSVSEAAPRAARRGLAEVAREFPR